MTDNEISAALGAAARDPGAKGHGAAQAICSRQHFKKVYDRSLGDHKISIDAAAKVFDATAKKFGEEKVRFDTYRQKGNPSDFPVLRNDNKVVSSLVLSEVMSNLPLTASDFIFCARDISTEAKQWIDANHARIANETTGG